MQRTIYPVYTFRDCKRVTIFHAFDQRAQEELGHQRDPGTNGNYCAPCRTVQVGA